MSRRTPRERGFTLFELLVALAVFTIMSAMAYGSLNTVIQTQERGGETLDRLAAVQRAMRRLEADLAQFTARSVRDSFGDPRAPLVANARNTYPLELTRRGWRNPLGRARSTLQRVAYQVEERRLVRYYWQALDRPPQAEPLRAELLTEVERMDMNFLDSDGNGHEQWPPIDVGRGATPVPLAVEVRIELAGMGEIRRLINLPDATR